MQQKKSQDGHLFFCYCHTDITVEASLGLELSFVKMLDVECGPECTFLQSWEFSVDICKNYFLVFTSDQLANPLRCIAETLCSVSGCDVLQ